MGRCHTGAVWLLFFAGVLYHGLMDELRQRERRSHDAEMSSPRCQRSKMNRCSTLGKIRKRRPVPLSSSGRKNIGSPTAAVPFPPPHTHDYESFSFISVHEWADISPTAKTVLDNSICLPLFHFPSSCKLSDLSPSLCMSRRGKGMLYSWKSHSKCSTMWGVHLEKWRINIYVTLKLKEKIQLCQLRLNRVTGMIPMKPGKKSRLHSWFNIRFNWCVAYKF